MDLSHANSATHVMARDQPSPEGQVSRRTNKARETTSAAGHAALWDGAGEGAHLRLGVGA